MPETSIASLDPQLQKRVESARVALDRGRPEQALEHCLMVLQTRPDCLPVRKLERAAQLKLAALHRNVVAKLVRAVSSAPFILGATLKLKDDPRAALETAERLLRRDPHSVSALNLLGQAATVLGWTETAIFAHQMASDLEPERIDLLISLGYAHLSGSQLAEAENTANEALALQPNNPDAHKLLEAVLVASASAKWEQGAAGTPRTSKV